MSYNPAIPMCKAALFIKSQPWKLPKCPWTMKRYSTLMQWTTTQQQKRIHKDKWISKTKLTVEVVAQLYIFTKAHQTVHLNGYILLHLHCTPIKLSSPQKGWANKVCVGRGAGGVYKEYRSLYKKTKNRQT